MSYELAYLPTFIDNLRIWYAEKYSSEEKLKAAFDRKINRITRYLEKEFQPIYGKYASLDYTSTGAIPRIIWIMWWQGEESIPPISQACLNSIKKYANDYVVKIITKENYRDYIYLDDVIGYLDQTKFRKARMILPYLSDIIRMRLLKEYGGIWIDSTVLVTNDSIFKLLDSQTGFFTLKTNCFVDNNLASTPRRGEFSEFFLASVQNNPFFSFVDECLTFHANNHMSSWDYLMNEYIIRIGMKHIPFIKSMLDQIPPSNPRLYWMEKHYNDLFSQTQWDEISETTNVFKLSNKSMTWDDSINNKTYLQYILDSNL